MAKSITLFERLKEKFSNNAKFFNPLEVFVGGFISIDCLGYDEQTFVIGDVREYRRHINGKDYCFTDYTLTAKPLDTEEVLVLKLRVVPADYGLTTLILRHDFESEYDAGLDSALEDETGEFIQTMDDKSVTYHRVNGIKMGYVAEVSTMVDANDDGKFTKDEVEKSQIKYWDFTQDGDNQNFLFIEKNLDSGYFNFWVGEPVDTSRIMVI